MLNLFGATCMDIFLGISCTHEMAKYGFLNKSWTILIPISTPKWIWDIPWTSFLNDKKLTMKRREISFYPGMSFLGGYTWPIYLKFLIISVYRGHTWLACRDHHIVLYRVTCSCWFFTFLLLFFKKKNQTVFFPFYMPIPVPTPFSPPIPSMFHPFPSPIPQRG